MYVDIDFINSLYVYVNMNKACAVNSELRL